MKQHLETLLSQAIDQLKVQGDLPQDCQPEVRLERTRDKAHGDFASSLALSLAKIAKRKPRELAEAIVAAIPTSDAIDSIDIAGPGFINFKLNAATHHEVINTVLNQSTNYGLSQVGAGKSIQVEFVSANPTGPLHVGHGRGAAYGAVVSNLLNAAGFNVHKEYYVNDAGRQMDILATSVWLRYLCQCGEDITFPANGYKGDYILDIAQSLKEKHGETLRHSGSAVMADLPADEPAGGDKEAHIDALIAKAKTLLGQENYRQLFDHGLQLIIDDIRQDLHEFGVDYDEWYSERSLTDTGRVDAIIERLKDSGHVYEKGGALWFRSTDYGDEKDRVVVRDNGLKTYFASDIAYHADKLERGFERVIDVWGADHHGYVPRVKAALSAIGDNPDRLDVLLVQFAILYRGGERAQMSTRSGEFVTLRQLREEVGNDAARFFYVMRKCEQHLDFDLDLAKSKSNENPVYYIQYAHARICSVKRQLKEQGLTWDENLGQSQLSLLTEEHEIDLINSLSRYPELIVSAAMAHEPHQLTHYLRELANHFHTYYNAHKFIIDDANLRNARLNLIFATRQVLQNGLAILGVSAPEEM